MITAQELQTARGAKRLTQAGLAALLGVSSRTIGNWENGSIQIAPRAYGRLRAVLDFTPAETAHGEGVQEIVPPASGLARFTSAELLIELSHRQAEQEIELTHLRFFERQAYRAAAARMREVPVPDQAATPPDPELVELRRLALQLATDR